MYYLLSDFKLIGAYFVPIEPLKTTTKKALIYGMLHYEDMAIPISIVSKLAKTPVIHRAYGENQREIRDNHKKLQALYQIAVNKNINNLRNIRHKHIMNNLRCRLYFFLPVCGLMIDLLLAIIYKSKESFCVFLFCIGCIAMFQKQCN